MKTHEAVLLFSKDFLARPESFWLRRKGMACCQHWEVPCHFKFWNRTYYWIERKSLIRDLAGKDCIWLLCVDNSCFWEWSLALPLTTGILEVELAATESPKGLFPQATGCHMWICEYQHFPVQHLGCSTYIGVLIAKT